MQASFKAPDQDLVQSSGQAIAQASSWRTILFNVGTDLLMLYLVLALCITLRWLFAPSLDISLYAHLLPCLLLAVPVYGVFDLYPSDLLSPQEELRKLTQGTSIIYLVIFALTFFLRTADEYSRLALLFAWLLSLLAMPVWRGFLKKQFAASSWWGSNVVVCGNTSSVKDFIRHLHHNPGIGLKAMAVVLFDEKSSEAGASASAEFVCDLGDNENYSSLAPESSLALNTPNKLIRLPRYSLRKLPSYAEDLNYPYAVMLLHTLDKSTRVNMAALAQHFRKTFFVFSFLGHLNCWSGVADLNGELALETRQKLLDVRRQRVKRLIDLMLTLGGAILFVPLTLVLAVLIKMEDSGPVFYSHQRLGKGGKPIRILKFRTMVPGADKVLQDYLAANPDVAKEWEENHKLKEDPRITRIGKWLRKTSLDELPQVWNVLLGDLSFVGPRPIVEDEIEKYGQEAYALYKRVLPGLTGFWQISGRSNTSYTRRVELDSYYIRNWSVWLDVYIIACTPRALLNTASAC